MKKISEIVFLSAAAVILATTCGIAEAKSFNIFDQTFSIKRTNGFIMSQNSVDSNSGMWNKTKDISSDVWEDTKDGTEKAWDKTKDVGSDVWDATKDGTEKVWDKTKDVSHDAWDATKEGAEKAKTAVTGD